MRLDPTHVAAILAMAIATYLTRIAGVLLVGRFRPVGRLKAALDALPVAILTAVITPWVIGGGPATMAAAIVTGLAAYRLPLLAAVALGVASLVLIRQAIG